MAITFSRKALLLTALFAAGVLVATLFVTRFLLGSDDENPIRVKNKQLRIETYEKNWTKIGGAEKWKMNNANPTASNEYIVTAYGANPQCTNIMRGTSVVITYEIPSTSPDIKPEVRTLSFALELNPAGKPIPVLTPSVAMTADNSKKRKMLQMTDDKLGAIASVEVAGTTCTFPSDRRVEVELCLHNCS